MAKEIVLGIDLGTTNSVVSYRQADGTVKVIPNPEGTNTTPSVVAFKANGEEISGSGNTYTFSMPDEDVEITAEIAELAQVELTLVSGTGGSFKVDNATHTTASKTAASGKTEKVTVYEGDKLTFTATASSGHCTDSITIAGNTYASNTQTFTVGTDSEVTEKSILFL